MKPYAERAVRAALLEDQSKLCMQVQLPGASALQQRLHARMTELIASNTACGIQVCVIKRGKVLANLGSGELSRADPRPVTSETLFNSFSCGKIISVLLVHIMADKGWIDDLDDPVSKYWPDFGGGAPKRVGTTVRMLLEHCGGCSTAVPNGYTLASMAAISTKWFVGSVRRIAFQRKKLARQVSPSHMVGSLGGLWKWLLGAQILMFPTER